MTFISFRKQKRRYAGAGLVAGLVAGLTAGLFLRSKKGQELTNDAMTVAKKLQKQAMKKARLLKKVTKENYEDMIDELLGSYGDAKDMAKGEAKRVKAYLMDQWEEIRDQLEEAAEDEKDAM